MVTPSLASKVRTTTIEGILVGVSGPMGYVLTYREPLGQPVCIYPSPLKDLRVIDPTNQFAA